MDAQGIHGALGLCLFVFSMAGLGLAAIRAGKKHQGLFAAWPTEVSPVLWSNWWRVTNDGQIPHDFVLGDEGAQDEHEEEMAEMEDMEHDEPNTLSVAVGETKELTWKFGEDGTVIFGCHQPGHHDGGMLGHVTVDQ